MRMKRLVVAVLLLGVIGLSAGAYYSRQDDEAAALRTAAVSRGAIVDAVATTGTLEAVTTVQVGTQVSGTISSLGADFNSTVRKGQVIAKLDPSLFEAQVAQAQANLAKAEADVEGQSVNLADAQQKLARARELGARQLLPQSELDAADVAVKNAQAQLRSAQAQVQQAQASLNQSLVNLQHTIITAPIDGIVIQRSVDVGQTVAASLQSPTVFAIAADMTKMQVNAAVDESDIGRVRPGQTVTFKVDAYPAETFTGTLSQVRLQPTVVSNVTTYTAIIDVPNPALKLKPGMTANARVEIAKRDEALRVPNAALRFRPSAETFAALDQEVPDYLQAGGSRVWAVADGKLQAVRVKVGITDGVNSEIIGGELPEQAQLATGMATSASTSTAVDGRVSNGSSRNPLMGVGGGPRPPGR
jgi:HlyD family secretion protein